MFNNLKNKIRILLGKHISKVEITSKGAYYLQFFKQYPDATVDDFDKVWCGMFDLDYEACRNKRLEKYEIIEKENIDQRDEWLKNNPNAKIVKVRIDNVKSNPYIWYAEDIGKEFEIYNIPDEENSKFCKKNVYYIANNIMMWGWFLSEENIVFL